MEHHLLMAGCISHDIGGNMLAYAIYLGKLSRPHCDLTGIMVNEGNHPQMALIQVSELL